MAWADMFMSYMYCFVVRNISLHIDYWWQDLSPLRLSGKLGGRRSYEAFSVFKINACQRDEGIVILAGFFAGFTGWCLSTTSSVSGGGSHVGMTTFSFQWITTELFFMKSHIYLKFYPFLWTYCDKIVFSYFMCTLSQTLFLSTSLLLGSFRYVFNIIIVLTSGTHKRGTCKSPSLKIGSNYILEPDIKTNMINFIKWICPSIHKTLLH